MNWIAQYFIALIAIAILTGCATRQAPTKQPKPAPPKESVVFHGLEFYVWVTSQSRPGLVVKPTGMNATDSTEFDLIPGSYWLWCVGQMPHAFDVKANGPNCHSEPWGGSVTIQAYNEFIGGDGEIFIMDDSVLDLGEHNGNIGIDNE